MAEAPGRSDKVPLVARKRGVGGAPRCDARASEPAADRRRADGFWWCGASRQFTVQARLEYNRTIGRILGEDEGRPSSRRAAKDGHVPAEVPAEADGDVDLPDVGPEIKRRHLVMSHVNVCGDDDAQSCVSTERTLSSEAPAIQRSTSAPSAQGHPGAPAVDAQRDLGFVRSYSSSDQAVSTRGEAGAHGQPRSAEHGRGAGKQQDPLEHLQSAFASLRSQRSHARNSTRIKPYERKVARTGSPALTGSGSSSPVLSVSYGSPARYGSPAHRKPRTGTE